MSGKIRLHVEVEALGITQRKVKNNVGATGHWEEAQGSKQRSYSLLHGR